MAREAPGPGDRWAEYQSAVREYASLAGQLEDLRDEREHIEERLGAGSALPQFKTFRASRVKRLGAREQAIERRIGELCAKVVELQAADVTIPRVSDTVTISYLRGKLLEHRSRLDHLLRLEGQRAVFKGLGLGFREQEVDWLDAENASLVRRIRRLEREQDAEDDSV